MKNLNTILLLAFSIVAINKVNAQAPGNDLICNATPLSIQLGCTQGTNVNATSTGSPAAPACWSPNNTSHDVWFSFVATVPDITVSTDAQGLTLNNTQVAVYSSSNNTCTGTLTLVACAENSGFNVPNNSVTDMTLVVGNTYFIRVDGNGTATGTFCISVADTYTPGSTPCEAQIIHPNSAACNIDNGNQVTNATLPTSAYYPIGVDYPGCDNETNQYGVWSTFVANSTSVTLRNSAGGARDFTLFTGDCNNLQWISCSSIANNTTTTLSNLTIGATYFLLTTLQGSATTTGQTMTHCITNNVTCIPPSNNNCANAMAVIANNLYHVTTYCATPDSPPLLCSGSLQNNIWFTWTCPQGWTGQAYFQLFNQNCGGGNQSWGTQVSIYNSNVTCGSTASCIATSNTQQDNNINVVWTPVVGQTYLINYDGNAGEVCEMEFQITNTASVVLISVNSGTICQGDSITLTATSPATGYLWSTGQTGSSITVSPSVTTTYTVSATAGGTGAATAVVTVNPVPASPVAGSNSPVCSGSTLNLTASTVQGATYSWTGPNNFTSSQQNPSIVNVTTAASGTYTVVATALNCPSQPATVQVTVNPLPPAPVASSNSPLCAGATLNLSATGTGNSTFSWTGPNNFTSSQQNPSISGVTTAASGTYSVTQTELGCTSAPGTTQVVVNPIPATPNAGSNSPICEGSTLTLTASTVQGATYSWTGPNNFTSSLQNPSIPNATTAATGTYQVVATALNCSSLPATVQAVVNPIPAAPVASSNSPLCAGSNLNLSATGSGNSTFSWTGPNNFTSSQQNPTISNAGTNASGTYNVTQTELGCTSTPGSTQVVVNPIPTTTASNNSPICLGATLVISATSFPNATYSWSGPNGFTSTQQNISISNAQLSDAGTYTVTISANGCVGQPSSTNVVINPIPSPVAGSNSPICAGATLNLTASTVGGASYTWTGPNGFFSSTQNPSISNATTAASGTYYVIASVTGCTDSEPDSVQVTVNPIPGVTASSNTPVCEGGIIELSATTFPGATYSWTGPNGFTSSLQNPTISNATLGMSGTYSVTSTASNCSSNTPATTTVQVVTTVPPVAGNNTPICAGQTINLTASAIQGADYAWTGPNGFTSNLQNPVITNATTSQSGTYSVVATISGCSSSSAATTNVVVNPIPAITASNNGPICAGANLELAASTFAGATYSWTGPNGFTSNQQNPVIAGATAAATGTYSVVATAAGCSSSQPATTNAIVYAIPPAPTAGSNSPLCEGGTISLSASLVPDAIYTWTGPNGFISQVQNPVISNATTAASGAYLVTASVNGCVSPQGSVVVIVYPIPDPPVAGSNSPVCENGTIQLTASTVANATYAWTGPDPFASNLQNPSIANATLADAGTYAVVVTVDGCTSAPATVEVEVYENPPAPIPGSNSPVCEGGTLLLTANTIPNATYLWTDPIGFPNNDQNPVITNVTLSAAGTYTVVAIVNGCVSDTATIDVVVSPLPTITFTSNAPVCAGLPVNFNNTGTTGADAYFWDFGAGATPPTSTLENPSGIIYSTGGTKTVTLTLTTPGCVVSASQTIEITGTPFADFTSDAPVCFPPGIVTFTDLSTGNIQTYFWDFGPGATPATDNSATPPPVTYDTLGTKTVMLTVNSGGCINTTTKTVDVGVVGADFTSSVPMNGDGGCVGHGENFYNIGSSGSGASHYWNFGAGATPATSTLENPTNIVYSTPGAKIVTHTVTVAACGLEETIQHIITINPTPVASFTSTAPVCANNTVDFTNTGSTGAGFTYVWNFGTDANPAGATSENPQGVTYSSAGNKTVTLTITNEFYCVAEANQNIVINAAPTASFNSTAPACTDLPVTFTNTGTGTVNTEWAWSFGAGANPATSNMPQPGSVVYFTAGSKTVTLTATDTSNGCFAAATQNFNIYQSPTAAFVSNAPQCSADGIDFTNVGSTGSNWSYAWSFGSGANPATSTAENPTDVTYSTGGTKTVTFTVADQNCTRTQTQSIVVDETPKVNISTTAPKCTGAAVDFTNSGTTTDVTWLWDFGADATPATSTVQNPTGVVYSSGGLKTVTLTATNTNTGCSVTQSINININQAPSASFSSTAPQCPNAPVDFTNTGTTGGGWTYIWSFGTGANPPSSASENPSVVYTTSGDKTVTFTIANAFCSSSSTQTIHIYESPIASFISTAPQCTGVGVEFTNTGYAPNADVTWLWDFGNGAQPITSEDEQPGSVVYTTPGAKVVTLTATDTISRCVSVATQTFNIYQSPSASFTSNAPQCSTSAFDFTNTGTTGGSWTYTWTFGSGATPGTSNTENPSGVTYASSGTKTVTFTISDVHCVSTAVQTITVSSTPVASFVSTAPKCTGLAVDFTNTGTLSNVTWAWDFGAGATPATSTDQDPTGVVYATAGTKTVTLITTDTASGCSVTATATFTINQSPTASFTSNAPQCSSVAIDFTNTGTTGSNWQYAWSFGVGANPAVSTAENPSGVMYASSGTKTVTFTISDQNCSNTAVQTIAIDATPTVSFVSDAPKCTGLPVNFGNTGSTTNTVWTWDFDTGATPQQSNDQHPQGIVYSTAGMKAITLTATDTVTGCSATTFNVITVYLSPTASFVSDAPQCTNTAVSFTNTGSTGVNWSYSWNFGEGAAPAVSTAENPTGITYSTSGVKTVTFTISDQNCTNTATQTITITPTPVVGFISTAPQCTGLPVNFENTSTGTANTIWSWNFGTDASPATSTDQIAPSVVYSTAGLKTVTLTATDTVSGCSVTATVTINIHQSPTASFTSNAPQCANTAINFTNTGSTGSNWSYFWNFGVGALPATSTAESPTGVLYSSAGSKTVTFTISDQNCTNTATQTITISSTPTASFAHTAPTCTGLGVDFKNTGTLTDVTWSWSLGLDANPATSTAQDPANVVYATAGVKTVTLTTTDINSGCSSSATGTFTIHQTPVATFTSNAPQCANVGIDFVNTGNTGSSWSYSWNFGLGASPSVSTAENPTGILYSSSGVKTVTLTIADQYCNNTSTQTITILETPRADFTSTAPQCTGLPVNFTNIGSQTGVTWFWTFGTGAAPANSTDQHPQDVVYSTAGVKNITLTITNSNTSCATTATGTIVIHQSPTATFTSNAPQCANVGINFTNTGSTGSHWSYSWDLGEGANPPTSNAQNPNGVLYSTGGTKLITFSISDANCTTTDTQSIVINSLPGAFAGLDTTICANRSVQLGTTAVAGNTYTWFPSSTLDNPFVSNPIASPVAPVTNYIVTVVNTATGCTNTDVVVVTMLPPLIANAGVDVQICANESVQIGAGLVEGQFYQWSPPDGLSSTTSPNPVASPSVTTTYTLVVTDTTGCDAVTDEVTVIVNPLPTADAGKDDTITSGGFVQLVGTGGIQFNWSPAEGLSNANLFNPVASPDSTTDYVLTVTDLFGCSNTDTVRIVVINFATPWWLPSAFTPDGNGHNDVLYVRGGGFKTFQFSIFNRYGELIFVTKNINTGWDGKNQFSNDDVPADAYVYKLNGVLENGEKIDEKGLVNLIR
ncbi:MAG: PKD domain-containing protein [Chitinophagales bacterium]|nr:PKD domain-containing protein [Chitinophagales bacterium]